MSQLQLSPEQMQQMLQQMMQQFMGLGVGQQQQQQQQQEAVHMDDIPEEDNAFDDGTGNTTEEIREMHNSGDPVGASARIVQRHGGQPAKGTRSSTRDLDEKKNDGRERKEVNFNSYRVTGYDDIKLKKSMFQESKRIIKNSKTIQTAADVQARMQKDKITIIRAREDIEKCVAKLEKFYADLCVCKSILKSYQAMDQGFDDMVDDDDEL